MDATSLGFRLAAGALLLAMLVLLVLVNAGLVASGTFWAVFALGLVVALGVAWTQSGSSRPHPEG